jgi:transposase InsO family protein
MMCDVLEVSRSGYYAWVGRPPSAQAQRREELTERIRQAHAESFGTYGSPRVHAELAGLEVKACVNTVAKLMKEAQIRSVMSRRFVPQTTDSNHDLPVADNVLDRDFSADAPDRKWACDITYVPTGQGTVYLAAVMDLYSRKIVGWAMAEHMRTDLCLEALDMAVRSRTVGPELVHHSDRGSQYASGDYARVLQSKKIQVSMSRKGNCYDNAAMESFWGSLKTEWVYPQKYDSLEQAKPSIFKYIELWYNRRRRHSAIGYVSPEQFEASRN